LSDYQPAGKAASSIVWDEALNGDVETGTQLVSKTELALITRIGNNRPFGRNTE
jgi:hypothetical protein